MDDPRNGLTRDEFLDTLKRGYCPYCGKGPYKIVATHIALTHNVKKKQLRDIALIGVGVQICSDESHIQRSDSNRQRNSATIHNVNLLRYNGKKSSITKEKLRLAALGKKFSPQTCQKISKAKRGNRSTLTEEMVKEIKIRLVSKEKYKSIANDYKVSCDVISNIACNRTFKYVTIEKEDI